MALYPYEGRGRRGFLDDFDRFEHSLFPYWRHLTPEHAFNTGSVLGEVTNTAEKFAVGVDVSQFRPEELKVSVTGHELSVEGHHEERTDEHGSIQRSFVRKWTLPSDVNIEGVRSGLANGKLTIEAPKLTIEGAQSRAIPITHHRHQ